MSLLFPDIFIYSIEYKNPYSKLILSCISRLFPQSFISVLHRRLTLQYTVIKYKLKLKIRTFKPSHPYPLPSRHTLRPQKRPCPLNRSDGQGDTALTVSMVSYKLTPPPSNAHPHRRTPCRDTASQALYCASPQSLPCRFGISRAAAQSTRGSSAGQGCR